MVNRHKLYSLVFCVCCLLIVGIFLLASELAFKNASATDISMDAIPKNDMPKEDVAEVFTAVTHTGSVQKDNVSINEISEAKEEINRRYIPWTFFAYAEPDFAAQVVDTFSPQLVSIIETTESGWASISTNSGACWIYLNNDVNLIKDDLDALIKKHGNGISVFYKNINSGYKYSYNEKKQYYAASIIKAPYVLYLYNLADKGELDLSKSYVYAIENYNGGAGVLKKMEYGTVLSEAELLRYSITFSDNAAFRMLIASHGVEDFKKFISESGGKANTLYSLTDASLNVMDVALYAEMLYDYIEKQGSNNEELKQNLLTSSSSYIIADYPIAHKYGIWTGAMHDMAIVYADSPYILIIMTNKGVSNGDKEIIAEARKIFEEISQKIQKVNKLFVYQ